MRAPRPSWWVATAGGLGRAPLAPGTVASAAAAAVWYLAAPTLWLQGVACGIAVVSGWLASDRLSKHLGDPDPSEVVIDEVAGMWLALFGCPRTLPILLAAFLLFRFFDIAKLPPMRQLERLPGGFGIMLDDVAAGIMTRLILAGTLLAVGAVA